MGDLFIDTIEMTFCPVLTLESRREERKQGQRRREGRGGKRKAELVRGKRKRKEREKERGKERMGRGEKREEAAGNSSLFLLEGHISHGQRAPLWSHLA